MMEYKLKDLFQLQMGKTPDRHNDDYWKNGIENWVSIADLSKSGKYIKETKERISATAIAESGIKIIPKDTVIMSFKLSIGKLAIASKDMYSNEAIMSFVDKGIIEIKPDYLYYLLMQKRWDKATNKAVMGETLNKATLSEIRIKVHEPSEQKVIISILDKTQDVIQKRKAQLMELDELTKSRFVEMFGDPVHNEKHWETSTVEDACDEIYGGGTPSKSHPEYYENGDIPWISSKDMKSDVLYDSQIRINQLGIGNSAARMVPIDSVIMVIRSGILKHTLPVAINAVPVTVNQDLKVFVPNRSILTRFLAIQFKMCEKDILSGVRAVTADNIEFNALKQRKIIVPPLELQNQFAAFVHQIDKSKLRTVA